MLIVYELARALAGQVGLSDAGDIIAKHLRRLIPASLYVFYMCDHSSDELEARHVVGDGGAIVRGSRLGLGQRLSGWVAANRQTILNSDAALDLGDVAAALTPSLRSCLSTPLLFDNELVGVLSLYSAEVNGFSDGHRRIIEVVARHIAHILRSATEFDRTSRRDALTGLPNLRQLEEFLGATGVTHLAHASAFALLFIDVVGLKLINTDHSRAAGDDALRHVVRHATAGLRLADILFRYGSDEFVALLNDTNRESAELVGRRIRDGIFTNPLTVSGQPLHVDVSVAAVCSPSDGDTLQALVEAARRRTAGAGTTHRGRSAD